MEANLVNPFIEGTLHILNTTASVKAKFEPPFLKTHTNTQGDISGILDISGDITGTVAISFSEKSILGVVSAMFGEDMTRIDDDIIDAVGEISNMVAGHVTTKIVEMDKRVKVKLDRVSVGADKGIEPVQGSGPVLVLPFKTTKGKLVIEVCYAA